MENTVFKRFLKEFKDGINLNKNVLDDAIKELLEVGEQVSLNKIIDVIDSYENIFANNKENKKIAIWYSGKPEITMTYIIDSVLYNNNVTLYTESYKPITEILYTIFNEVLLELKIKNEWIEYNSNLSEKALKENENNYDEIVYVGDYFEYEKFKTLFKRDITYNNYGYIKILIDKIKYQEEYKKIITYTYVENIVLDVYNVIEEFISESNKEDFLIAYVEDEKIDKLKNEINSEELLINTFPYEAYKFKIKR